MQARKIASYCSPLRGTKRRDSTQFDHGAAANQQHHFNVRRGDPLRAHEVGTQTGRHAYPPGLRSLVEEHAALGPLPAATLAHREE